MMQRIYVACWRLVSIAASMYGRITVKLHILPGAALQTMRCHPLKAYGDTVLAFVDVLRAVLVC